MKKYKNIKLSILTAIFLCIIMTCTFTRFGLNHVYAEEEASLPEPPIITGAQIDEGAVSEVYYVDGSSDISSDQNSGTQDQPFKTIKRAIEVALENIKSGKGTKILIHPGVYREKIEIIGTGRNSDAPIILEGLDKDSVIIKGSIILEGSWQQSDDYYTHPWPYNWGIADDIYLNYGLSLDEIIRRREMIFVNGMSLKQVLHKEDLVEGSFFVDEAEDIACLMPPADVDMENSVVEVPTIDTLVDIQQISRVALKNLTFTQTNTFHPGSAVSMYRVSHIMLENCDITWNNFYGLGFHSAQSITFKGLSINNNGGGGIIGSSVSNVLIADSETSNNNWRGMRGDYYDWHTSGIKLLVTRGVEIRNHVSNNNFAPGIWFDSDCRDVIIKDSKTMGNRSPGESIVAGIYLEGGIGPYFVERCISVGNRRGVNISSANDVYIIDSIIADNETSQIYIFGNFGHGRKFDGVTAYAIDNRIENTVISASEQNTEPLFNFDYNDPGGYVRWSRSLSTSSIKYYHPDAQAAFLLADARTRGDLAQWQEASGLDYDAEWLSERYVYVEEEPDEGDTGSVNGETDEAVGANEEDDTHKTDNEEAKDKTKPNAGIYILIAGALVAALIVWLGTRKS